MIIAEGSLIYASRTPTYPSGAFPLTIRDRTDVLLDEIDPATSGAPVLNSTRMCQVGPDLLLTGTAGMYRFDVASGTFSSPYVAVGGREQRVDNSGRLVVLGQNFAYRYNPDLSIDINNLVLDGTFIGSNALGIHPNGHYVYNARVGPGATLNIRRVDLDVGGTASIIASRSATGYGNPALTVAADGTVVVVVEEITGAGIFMTNPYVNKLWVFTYDQNGSPISAFDITSQVPDINHWSGGAYNGTFFLIDYDLQAPSNAITTDTFGGGNNLWFISWYSSTPTASNYVFGLDLDTGVIFETSPAHLNGSNTAMNTSSLLVYSGAAPVLGRARSWVGKVGW